MTAVPPHARASPELAAAGSMLVASLFGDVALFLHHDRNRLPMTRRGTLGPISMRSDVLWSLLEEERLDAAEAQFRLVRARDGIFDIAPLEQYTRTVRRGDRLILLPDPTAVRELYAHGYSLAAQLIDRSHADYRQLCDALSAFTGYPTQLSAYLSPPGVGALQVHHDTHDVVIVQCEGEKTYELYTPVIDRPISTVYLDPAALDGRVPDATVTLQPGDVLYLPRGYPHRAVAGATGSLHLTLGLLSTSWASLMPRLADEMRYAAALRLAPELGVVFDGDALRASADTAVEALVDWLREHGAERLAALAAETLVLSLAARGSEATDDAGSETITAIEHAPGGDVIVHAPSGAHRIAAKVSVDPAGANTLVREDSIKESAG